MRHAYRRKALDAHPDRRAEGTTDDEMAALNEAWHVLGDPARRARYDAALGMRTQAPTTSPPPRPTPPPPPDPAEEADDWDDELGERPVSDALLRRWAMVIGFLFFLLVGFGVLTIWLGFGN